MVASAPPSIALVALDVLATGRLDGVRIVFRTAID
jgi:hypothetical protein